MHVYLGEGIGGGRKDRLNFIIAKLNYRYMQIREYVNNREY